MIWKSRSSCLLEASFDAWLLEVFIALKISFAWQKFCSICVCCVVLRLGAHSESEALGMGYFFNLTITSYLTPLPIPQSSISFVTFVTLTLKQKHRNVDIESNHVKLPDCGEKWPRSVKRGQLEKLIPCQTHSCKNQATLLVSSTGMMPKANSVIFPNPVFEQSVMPMPLQEWH